MSITSPVGKGLLNTQVGDKVKVQAPAGILDYEILEIS
ncbi:MAG: GreA/GreB family elongation factor [Ignavibacteriaceae bacterium]|nr:GreA/GreB family elongation factor [Ignavibacteriaceae bacterium]